MAVRNLGGITRCGNMLAEQKANEKRLRDDYFWKRVELIRDTKPQAIDAVDTIKALREHGLLGKFEQWDRRDCSTLQVQTSLGNPIRFKIKAGDCIIFYEPQGDYIEFSWSAHGMIESYSTKNSDMDYVISAVSRKDSREYDMLLTALATRLRPYLEDFFKWVDTL